MRYRFRTVDGREFAMENDKSLQGVAAEIYAKPGYFDPKNQRVLFSRHVVSVEAMNEEATE